MQWLLLYIIMCPASGGRYNDDPKICEMKIERFNSDTECQTARQQVIRSGAAVCFKVAQVN
jgi:hypothetical protein